MALRIVFMGTPDFSVPTLNALSNAGHNIVCCYTQPPRPAGRRGLELKPSPVQTAATALDIPVRSPVSLKGQDEQIAFAHLDADVAVVVAYGLLLPKPILEAPRHGCYNGHASLLPRWRGAAPIQRALMAGDKETGVMIMKMDEGLDTGDIAMEARCTIGPHMTAGDLHDQLAAITAKLMVDAMQGLEADAVALIPQSKDGITYASKISKEETRIDWHCPANEIRNAIMGLSPFPGAWCEMDLVGKPQRVKILKAATAPGEGSAGTVLDNQLTIACGKGAIQLQLLQKAGSRPVVSEDFLRGNRLAPGTVLA